MSEAMTANRLDRAVDDRYDHVLGPGAAPITLVEYGSYDCPHCRAANERIAEIRNQLGDRVRYVFRHRPIRGSELEGPTRFDYHDGYYDPVEKQFRGFARVEQTQFGNGDPGSLVTCSQFYTGRTF